MLVTRSAAIAALLVLLLASMSLGGCRGKNGDADESSEGTLVATSTVDSAGANATYDGWVVVTLVDQTPVFGIPADGSDSDFLLLGDAFYVAGDDESDVTLLRRFGNEIHRPQPFLAIPWDAVLYQEPLSTESKALAAIVQFEQSNPASGTVEPIVGGTGMSAIFLKTGEVFFGSATVDGRAVVVQGAHFLRFKDEDAADAGEIKNLDQVELVPESQSPAGPSGAMTIPLRSILYMQKLTADSPVVDALNKQ